MYELVKINENNYYIQSPAKIGVFKLNETDVILIDSGNDKDAGKKIKKILTENGWNLKAIFNTHSHADHVGGNRYLEENFGCEIFTHGIEVDLTRHTILEPSLLYGANPISELKHKFLMATPSNAQEILNTYGMEILNLKGHSFDMIGFKTKDGVAYIGDAFLSENTLGKYKISYIWNIKQYLQTLENLKTLSADYFVPSHCDVTQNITSLIQVNINTVFEIADSIEKICQTPLNFEAILEKVFEQYNLKMTFEQYALVGSTVKSYLTYLKEEGRIAAFIEENKLLFKKVQ